MLAGNGECFTRISNSLQRHFDETFDCPVDLAIVFSFVSGMPLGVPKGSVGILMKHTSNCFKNDVRSMVSSVNHSGPVLATMSRFTDAIGNESGFNEFYSFFLFTICEPKKSSP